MVRHTEQAYSKRSKLPGRELVGTAVQQTANDEAIAGDGSRNGADRVLATLRLLGSFPHGVGLNDLAKRLNSPKSSIHRALGSLRRAGLVEQDRDGKYRLGYGFLKLAFSYYEDLDDISRIRPVLTDVAERFGETVHYAVLDRSEIVYLAKVQPAEARFQMTSVIGGRNPAHCTGLGKTLLAYSLPDKTAVDEYVRRFGPLERRTPNTIVSAAGLHRDLAQIRARGYGTDREESEPGINCLALPLFLTSGSRPDGAISITAIAQRFPLDRLVASVDAARTIVREKLGEVIR
jgi:IclR family transcriptional regulator, acetate operon repressor